MRIPDDIKVRQRLHELFLEDPERREAISNHPALVGVRDAVRAWAAKEPYEWAYTDEVPEALEVIEERLLDEKVRRLIMRCSITEYQTLQVRDKSLRRSAYVTWLTIAMRLIKPEMNSNVASDCLDLLLYRRAIATQEHWTFSYKRGPFAMTSYDAERRRIDSWLDDVKSQLYNSIAHLKSNRGRPRKSLDMNVECFYLVRRYGWTQYRIANQVFGDSSRGSDVRRGIRMVEQCLAASEACATDMGYSR